MPHLDQTDARLLDLLQRDFPLAPDPFARIGDVLSVSPPEVLLRVRDLKARGIIRQISAIFDSIALGYRSALAAFRVADDKLDKAARPVAAHSGVSHCYSRDASFNLWFTITLPPERGVESEVEALAQLARAQSHIILPALKVFKIGVFLGMTEESASLVRSQAPPAESVPLTPDDRVVVRALQSDLPLTDRPFAELAQGFGTTEEALLASARRFLDSGTMRRFAAVLSHRRAGYRANAMLCWVIPDPDVDEAGERLSADPSVSHCYRRPPRPDWPYSLYAMVHCRTEGKLETAAERLKRLVGPWDCAVLRTLKEYKKSRVRYFV